MAITAVWKLPFEIYAANTLFTSSTHHLTRICRLKASADIVPQAQNLFWLYLTHYTTFYNPWEGS